MPEWLVEDGIGETRAILVENDRALAAKLRWPGELVAGQQVTVKLTVKRGSRGTGTLDDGREVLLDRLPKSASEGANLAAVITRGAIAERGRLKLPSARPLEAASLSADDTVAAGRRVHRFPAHLWEEIWEEASAGQVDFAGGSLLLSVTPAMTVIDIDGELPPRQLALAAVKPIAQSLRRFDLGGAIGIDFPTLEARDDRKAVDAALAEALEDWPHERTAMNGFGFVQLVARMEGPSLLHRFATARTGMAARMALRRAERVEGAGMTLLTVHPALKAKLKPEWLEEVERRTARPLRIETDPGLAIEAATAQITAHD